MELEEYLKAIEVCPDEIVSYKDSTGEYTKQWKLTAEHGIYDNYVIILKASFEKIENFLEGSDYGKTDFRKEGEVKSSWWNYNPGTIVVSLKELDKSTEEKVRQIYPQYREFDLSLQLNPYQGTGRASGKRINEISDTRAITRSVLHVGQWALNEKIPLIIPHSVGWRYLKDSDKDSRIVSFRPDKNSKL